MKNFLKKKKSLTIIGLCILVLSIIGISYAYWMLTKYQEDKNIISSKCFKVTMAKEGTGITLEKAQPISEEEGQSLEGYTFSIENTCSTIAAYQINLEEIELPEETKRLSGEYIKVSLNGSKGKKLDLFDEVDPTFQKDEEGNGVITDESHKLTTGKLDPGETKDFTLKLWMSDDTPAKDETMNALFRSKVSIINSYKEDENNEIIVDTISKNETYSKESDTVEITATSKLYDLKEYSFDDNEYFPIEQGTQKYTLEKTHDTEGTYTIYFKDIEGNKITKEYETSMLDQKGPEIEVTNEEGTLKIKFQDAKSGNKEYKIETDTEEGNWTTLNGEQTTEINYPIEENMTILISVKDNVGNESSTEYYTLQEDSNNPQTTVTKELQDWGTKDIIHLTLTDNESGIKEITILKDENEIYHEILKKAVKTYQYDQEVTENGTYIIKVKDLYNNETTSEVVIDKIDTNPPETKGTISANGKTVTIDLSTSIDNETKIDHYEYCLNEECVTSTEPTHTFENVQGNYDIIGRAYDQNNNYSEIKEKLLVDPAAKIEETKYATLQNAIDAATENQTITILRDINEAVEITEDKKIILEIGEHTINSNIEETPTILNHGTLTINSGTITSNDNLALDNYNTATILGGTISSKTNTIAIRQNANLTISGENTKIGGADLIFDDITYPTIFVESNGQLIVENGELTSVYSAAIYVHSNGQLTIKNGQISSSGNSTIQNAENSTVEILGGTINSENYSAITSSSTVNITGGTISGKQHAIDIKNGGDVTISEGVTIESIETQEDDLIYVHEGGKVTINNATITGHTQPSIYGLEDSNIVIESGNITSESTAIITHGTATISGGTITGEANTISARNGSNITISGETTQIGGNDKKTADNLTYPTIYIYSDGAVTIQDGNITSINSTVIKNEENSTLTISGGNITSEASYVINSLGTTTINGGTFTSPGLVMTIGETSTTNITNVDIISNTSSAITNYGNTTISDSTIKGIANSIVTRSNSSLTILGNTTIGGNDKLSDTGTGYPTVYVYSNATLTVQDGTILSNNSSTIYGQENSNVNILNGSFTSDKNVAIDSSGTVNISGGTITGTNSAINIRNNSNVTISGETTDVKCKENQTKQTITIANGGSLTVNGGNITGTNQPAIYSNKTATLEISDGTITANNSLTINSYGTTSISGGNITSDVTFAIDSFGTTSISGGTISGGSNTILVESNSNVTISGETTQIGGNDKVSSNGEYEAIYVYKNGNLNIENGTITSNNYSAILSQENSTVEISGGTITSNKKVAIDSSGTTNISGGTIIGTNNAIDILNTSHVTISGDATIKVSGTQNDETIFIYSGGRLTVNGGNIIGNNEPAIYNPETSTLEITSGNITAEASNAITNEGTLTISGGSVISKSNIAINNYNTANISGGTIKGTSNTITARKGSTTTISENAILGGADLVSDTGTNYPTIWVYDQAELNVSGGTITSINSNPIHSAAGSIVNISGGTITSETKMCIDVLGTVTITDGTIRGAQNSIVVRTGGNLKISGENTQIGGADQVSSSNSVYPTIYVYEEALVNVENGTIKSINGSAIYSKATSTINISGGTFTSEKSIAIKSYGTTDISGGTITGVANAIDVQTDSHVTISGNTTVNINGTQKNETIYVYEGGDLTINNGNISGNNKAAIYIKANSTVNITGGSITSNSNAINNYGTLTITGGLVQGKTNSIIARNNSSVTISGETTQIGGNDTLSSTGGTYPTISMEANATVDIKGCNLISKNGSGIKLAESANLTISDGTINSEKSYGINSSGTTTITNGTIISGKTSAINSYATTNISGGIITGKTNTLAIRTGSNATISGNATIGGDDIVSDTGSTYATIALYGNATLNVQNGTIISKNATDIQAQLAATLNISGGTFISDQNDALNISSITTITGGDIKGAIYARTGSTTTINGTANITYNGDSNSPAIYAYTNAKVEIQNGTISSKNSEAIQSDKSSTLNISGGTINSDSFSAIHNSGTATISGGTITGLGNTIVLNANSNTTISEKAIINGKILASEDAIYPIIGVYENATLEIQGGTINAEDQPAIMSYGKIVISGPATITNNSATWPTIFNRGPNYSYINNSGSGATITNNGGGLDVGVLNN